MTKRNYWTLNNILVLDTEQRNKIFLLMFSNVDKLHPPKHALHLKKSTCNKEEEIYVR